MPGYGDWFSAFCELSTERQIGMSLGPIPHSAIAMWITANGLEDEAREFLWCIRSMDNAYLDYMAQDPNARRNVASEPMTPALFKAMAGKGKT